MAPGKMGLDRVLQHRDSGNGKTPRYRTSSDRWLFRPTGPRRRGFFPSKESGLPNPAPGHLDRDLATARTATWPRRGLALHLYGAAVDS